MDVYDKIQEIVLGNDIISCAHDLQEFVQQARKETNRRKLVEMLYERITEPVVSSLMCSRSVANKKYCVFNGPFAVCSFLLITLPSITTPLLTLQQIEEYAQELLDTYSAPETPVITPDSVTEIMDYLDKEYDFSNKVFLGNMGHFIILNATHKDVGGTFSVYEGYIGGRRTPVFFLYANKEGGTDTTPECILFHELGHALHYYITGDTNIIPSELIATISALCLPRLPDVPPYMQREIIADVFAVGLMRNTPFERFDRFTFFEEHEKDVFARLVKEILS